MRLPVVRAAAERVAEEQVAGQRVVQHRPLDLEVRGAALQRVRRPGAGVAVRLRLHHDRPVARHLGALLDRVPPLVREHHRDQEVAELLLQLGEQALPVPGHDVLRGAVEGVAADVGRVVDARGRLVAARVDRVEALDLLVPLVEDVRHLLGPELLDVGDRVAGEPVDLAAVGAADLDVGVGDPGPAGGVLAETGDLLRAAADQHGQRQRRRSPRPRAPPRHTHSLPSSPYGRCQAAGPLRRAESVASLVAPASSRPRWRRPRLRWRRPRLRRRRPRSRRRRPRLRRHVSARAHPAAAPAATRTPAARATAAPPRSPTRSCRRRTRRRAPSPCSPPRPTGRAGGAPAGSRPAAGRRS